MSSSTKSDSSRTMRIDLVSTADSSPQTTSRPGEAGHLKSAAAPGAHGHKARQSSPGTPLDRAILENFYDSLLVLDQRGHVQDANIRAEEMLGYTRELLMELTLFDIVSGDCKDLFDTLRTDLQGRRFALILAFCVRSDTSMFPAEIAVNYLPDSGVFCFCIRDITLRRQAEERLHAEHNALNNATTGVVITDLESRIEYANPATASLWQFEEPDAMRTIKVCDLIANRQDADNMIKDVLNHDKGKWVGETVATSSDGSRFDVQISAALNRDTDGVPVGMVFSFLDITDRKCAEEAQLVGERERVMIASLASASHHLGEPLTKITYCLDILNRQRLGASVEKVVSEANKSVADVNKILERLRNVSQYRTEPCQPEDKNEDASSQPRMVRV